MVRVCSFHGRMAQCFWLHEMLTGERRGAMRGVRANAESLDPTSSDQVTPKSLEVTPKSPDQASPSQALRAPGQEADCPVYNDWDEV